MSEQKKSPIQTLKGLSGGQIALVAMISMIVLISNKYCTRQFSSAPRAEPTHETQSTPKQ